MTKAAIFRVGLTGGIGSGKSTVAERFQALGAPLVDTDVIAHRLTAPGGAAMGPIRHQFGDEMVAADGSLDRAAMRGRVFSQPAARQSLEAILHPMIRAVADDEVAGAARAGAAYVLLAIPLLVETGHHGSRVERVLVVDCPEAVQIARVMKRSGLGREQVEAVMRAQASREERLRAADDVIDNGGDESRLDEQVERLHRTYATLGRAFASSAAG
ncbi:MAG: dephospho-CoA kinase [Lautropia sp.]|nr:dephospho-CoA kinase [Lautropia sp.]